MLTLFIAADCDFRTSGSLEDSCPLSFSASGSASPTSTSPSSLSPPPDATFVRLFLRGWSNSSSEDSAEDSSSAAHFRAPLFLLHCAGGAFFGAAFVGAFARPLAMLTCVVEFRLLFSTLFVSVL